MDLLVDGALVIEVRMKSTSTNQLLNLDQQIQSIKMCSKGLCMRNQRISI